jgi:hypothetical protein
MAAKLGVGFGPEEKARAFAGYLEEIGLPVERVLGDLGPAEVGDVVSFFYAGMPDRFKDGVEDGPSDHDGSVMPAEHWCAAVWEAEDRPALTA